MESGSSTFQHPSPSAAISSNPTSLPPVPSEDGASSAAAAAAAATAAAAAAAAVAAVVEAEASVGESAETPPIGGAAASSDALSDQDNGIGASGGLRNGASAAALAGISGGTLAGIGEGAVVGANSVPANEERDIVREYLDHVRSGAPHDARRYHEACEVAYARKPGGLAQAKDALELARLSNAQCKVMLSVMNVTGCKNACLAAKRYILACKMVQRQVALQALFDITTRHELVQAHEQRADGGTPEEEVARIKRLPKTSASADTVRPGLETSELVTWARGDVPVFVDGDVAVATPSLDVKPPMPHPVTHGASPADQRPVDAPRVGRPRKAEPDDPRPLRRRRFSSGDALMVSNAELQVKEAEAAAASAKAVQETLKAIREAEAMLNQCEQKDESGRAFYRSIIGQLRQKMISLVGGVRS